MSEINENLRQELLAMRDEDLRVREELAATGELFDGYHKTMEAVHLKNAARLEELINEHGWLGKSKVGDDGAESAWLIAQHAISLPAFSRKALEMLKKEAERGEVPAWQSAYLEDRINFFEGKPQRYGTQSDWNENGEMQVWTLESEEKVNEYRASVGLEPLTQKTFRSEEFAEHAPKDFAKRQQEFLDWAWAVGWRE